MLKLAVAVLMTIFITSVLPSAVTTPADTSVPASSEATEMFWGGTPWIKTRTEGVVPFGTVMVVEEAFVISV